MEALDPAIIAWMKAQGAYTRSILDGIKPMQHLHGRCCEVFCKFRSLSELRVFWRPGILRRAHAGVRHFDLIVRDKSGTRKIVDIAALRAANGGKPFAVNYFLASPDGGKVAVGVSEGGSEEAVMTVYDAANGAKIAGSDRSGGIRRHGVE